MARPGAEDEELERRSAAEARQARAAPAVDLEGVLVLTRLSRGVAIGRETRAAVLDTGLQCLTDRPVQGLDLGVAQ
jgi:hypothetical protein